MSRRTYTLDQYRRDVASLPPAPGLRQTLAAAVIADAELAPASVPPASGVQTRRPTLLGVAAPPPVVGERWAATAAVLRELATPEPPASDACLRAAGLTPRPSGRVR